MIFILFSSCNYSHRNVKNPYENSRDSIGRTFLGEEIARDELAIFIKNRHANPLQGRVLIANKEMLISIAEPILFELFGKEDIISSRPYEAYLFEDYWIMMGTLPSGMKGGTFTIAINQKTCEVIGITHGK
jgi:hypothetical protein